MADNVVCLRFGDTWQRYDVINEGKIEADRMPGFFRHLIDYKVHFNFA